MNDLISVIIPVYNVEKYLEKCIKSVINQTYTNLEIILVDDGSTDNSGNFCDIYAKKDSRIVVLHKQNGGLSDARNNGIEIATGQFITFVDGDDYVDHMIISQLYESIKKYDCEIATCRYRCIWENTEEQNISIEPETISLPLDAETALKNMLYQKYTTNSAWCKLYDLKLFSNIRYPVGHNYEDLGTTYKLFAKSDRVVLNNFVGYFYLQRDKSIMRSKFDAKRIDGLMFAKKQLEFIDNHYPRIINSAQNRLFIESIYILVAMQNSSTSIKNIEDECFAIIRDYRLSVFLDSESNRRPRIYAVFSFFSIRLLIKILARKSRIKSQKAT